MTAPRSVDDAFTRRARPGFLYVMYVVILWAIPVGVIAAVSPETAARLTRGMAAYLGAIPEPMWATFATIYLGYTAAREWGKRR